MAQTHWPGKLPCGIDSTALWAIRPAHKLLVFVHGFRGAASTTWNDFSTLLQTERSYAGYDVIFYGYDGFGKQANVSGANLHYDLDDFLTSPTIHINPKLNRKDRRPESFSYERIILVGHSLGAVVARRAVLDAYGVGREWAPKVELAFFAPAHIGANVVELASEAATSIPYIGRLIAPVLRFKGTVLQSLEKNCPTLNKLLSDTEQAVATGATYVLAKAVWFGEYENIVDMTRFSQDAIPARPFQGRGHLDVCKPRQNYLQPLRELGQLL
jgi:predicted alpha/beta-fold hydrolase